MPCVGPASTQPPPRRSQVLKDNDLRRDGLRRVRDRRYGRTFVALYVCDGRDIDGEDDDEGPEVATKFAKPVRRGRRRDDDDA